MVLIEHLQGVSYLYLCMCIRVSPEQNFELKFLGSRMWSFRITHCRHSGRYWTASASLPGAGPAPAQVLGAFWQFLL